MTAAYTHDLGRAGALSAGVRADRDVFTDKPQVGVSLSYGITFQVQCEGFRAKVRQDENRPAVGSGSACRPHTLILNSAGLTSRVITTARHFSVEQRG